MRFDASLPELVRVVRRELGDASLEAGTILRDATGCLAFFPSSPLPGGVPEHLRKALSDALGPYARPDRVLALPDEPGARGILVARACTLRVDDLALRVVDRRIVGADWLAPPPRVAELDPTGSELDAPGETTAPARREPQRVVFASMKGGVGRSTALAVLATQLADNGRNVLVVDLDLEAPGVGILLTKEKPRFGALDHLVEQNLGSVTGPLDDFIATRPSGVGGVVDVVPVAGTVSDSAPENFMAKLSRAMTEAVQPDGEPLSFAGKVEALLTQLEARRPYDFVLVDVRAGLAEIAAGPLLSLGAKVLLFGTAQQQTIDDLRFLFAHLATLVPPGARSPWSAIKMVHAKARTNVPWFRDQLWNLFLDHLYEEDEGGGAFNFDAENNEAPHYPISVPFDPAFHDWDPFAESELDREYFERTFAKLRRYLEDLVTEGAR